MSPAPSAQRSAPAAAPDATSAGARRVLVHDCSGHPFQVQLSRELARRGHEVLHVYCRSFESPRGQLALTPDDPQTLTVRAIDLDAQFAKYKLRDRLRHELVYGRRLLAVVDDFRPDVVIESNDPLLTKLIASRGLRRRGIPWVFWLQDFFSVAIAQHLRRRLGRVVGGISGRLVLAVEGRLLRSARAVVPITDDFDSRLDRWRIAHGRREVIPNWAPVEEVVRMPSSKAWARSEGILEDKVVLYSGTLGMKHDPAVLRTLAEHLSRSDTAVVVISGKAAAAALTADGGLPPNLHVLPFQPWEKMSEVFASADLVLTLLNEDAGAFSVPSKVLTYLCAGRAIVASVPSVNQAARVIEDSGAGVVVTPGSMEDLFDAVRSLLDDDEQRLVMGKLGRAYAEEHFDIARVGARFSAVIERAVGSEAAVRGAGHGRLPSIERLPDDALQVG